MTKVMTTHVMLDNGAILHVAGTREDVIKELVNAGYLIDLVIYAKKSDGSPFQKTLLGLGVEQVNRVIVAGEHLIEVSDEPWGTNDEDAPSVSIIDPPTTLEVTL